MEHETSHECGNVSSSDNDESVSSRSISADTSSSMTDAEVNIKDNGHDNEEIDYPVVVPDTSPLLDLSYADMARHDHATAGISELRQRMLFDRTLHCNEFEQPSQPCRLHEYVVNVQVASHEEAATDTTSTSTPFDARKRLVVPIRGWGHRLVGLQIETMFPPIHLQPRVLPQPLDYSSASFSSTQKHEHLENSSNHEQGQDLSKPQKQKQKQKQKETQNNLQFMQQTQVLMRRGISAGTELSNLSDAVADDDADDIILMAAGLSSHQLAETMHVTPDVIHNNSDRENIEFDDHGKNMSNMSNDEDTEVHLEHATWTDNPGRDVFPSARLVLYTMNENEPQVLMSYDALASEVWSSMSGTWLNNLERHGRCANADEQYAAAQSTQLLVTQIDFPELNGTSGFPLAWLSANDNSTQRLCLEIDLASLSELVCRQRVLHGVGTTTTLQGQAQVVQDAMPNELYSSVFNSITGQVLRIEDLDIRAHVQIEDLHPTDFSALCQTLHQQKSNRLHLTTPCWLQPRINQMVSTPVEHLSVLLDRIRGVCTELLFVVRQVAAESANTHNFFQGQNGGDAITHFGLFRRMVTSDAINATAHSLHDDPEQLYEEAVIPMSPALYSRVVQCQDAHNGEVPCLAAYIINFNRRRHRNALLGVDMTPHGYLNLDSPQFQYVLHLAIQPGLGPFEVIVWARGWKATTCAMTVTPTSSVKGPQIRMQVVSHI